MRHNLGYRKLGRTKEHRRALLRNLATDLFRHERLTTTLPKAKELRPYAERLITLARRGDLVQRGLRRIHDMQMARRRVEGHTPRPHQATLAQVHLGDHRPLKAPRRVGCDAHQPRPRTIQDEEVSARRIDRQALRLLQAKPSSVVGPQRRRIQIPIRPQPDLKQVPLRRLQKQQAPGLAVKGHVDRVGHRRRDAHRANPILDQGRPEDIETGRRRLRRSARLHHQ